MKVVLLAGGFGSRISEESQFKPKPMIEIGGMPILWHIMKEYAFYGYTDFIICAGYKQEYIKQWFANYFLYNSYSGELLSEGLTIYMISGTKISKELLTIVMIKMKCLCIIAIWSLGRSLLWILATIL